MTPNLAFELLDVFDLFGYQKLILLCGMPGRWKGGTRALAVKLGISPARVTKLKQRLIEVEFIKVVPGDAAHGEADEWIILDIWERNAGQSTCSPNDTDADTCSRNSTGQKPVNTGIPENQPVHETSQPCSPNDTRPCSRNSTHEEKIFTGGNIQEQGKHTISARAREAAESFENFNEAEEFEPVKQPSEGWQFPMKELFEAFPRLELVPAQVGLIEADVGETDTDRAAWISTVKIYRGNYNPRRNYYNPEKVSTLLSVFRQQKRNLEKELSEQQQNETGIQRIQPNGNGNGNGNGHQPQLTKRDIAVINRRRSVEADRTAAAERRRTLLLQKGDPPDR